MTRLKTLYHFDISITSYTVPFGVNCFRTAGGHMSYGLQFLWLHVRIQDYVRYDASKDKLK